MENPITTKVAETYLNPLRKNKMDTLVLGCTHYPLLKKTIGAVVGPRINLIDSAEETAAEVEARLAKNKILNASGRRGKAVYYVTDNAASFSKHGRQFLGNSITPPRRLRLDSI
jgi:glutamate racemase